MELQLIPGDKFSRFIVEHHKRRQYTLVEPLLYVDKEFGEIVVPKGFDTDLASIDVLRPKFTSFVSMCLGYLSSLVLWLVYLMLIGYGDRAAAVHDYLYRNGCPYKVTRKVADRVFYNALRECGIARWRCWIYYAGVRVGGFYAFQRK